MSEAVPPFQTSDNRQPGHQFPWQGLVPMRVVAIDAGGNVNLVRCVRASRDYDGLTPAGQSTGAREYVVYVKSAKAVGDQLYMTLVPGGTPAKLSGTRVFFMEAVGGGLPTPTALYQVLQVVDGPPWVVAWDWQMLP